MIPLCPRSLALLFLFCVPLLAADALPTLLACSSTDQVASFRLADGSIVLAEPGTPLRASDQLTLERVLPDRVVLTFADPLAPNQLVRIWIDISQGIDKARVQTLANLPSEQPELIHYEKPVIIPLEGAPIFTGTEQAHP